MEFSGGRFAKRRRGLSLVELCERFSGFLLYRETERERERRKNADTVSEFQGVVKGTSNINKRTRENWLLEAGEDDEKIAAIYAVKLWFSKVNSSCIRLQAKGIAKKCFVSKEGR